MPRKDTQPTKQVGEYLVAAELARKGLVCATFSGNVRHYDIVASGPDGGHVAVQVKAKTSGAWQLRVDSFAAVRMAGVKQVIGQLKPEPFTNLVVIFVALGRTYGSDQFFVLPWRALQSILVPAHKSYLARHGGSRPKNPLSLHTSLVEAQITAYRANWSLIDKVIADAA